MAGTNDVNAVNISSFADLLRALNALESFVDTLFQACPNATVVVRLIPAIGYKDFGWPMSTKQMLVSQWNAWTSQMVNRKRAQHGYHLLKVHATVTVYNHYTKDPLHPNDGGYQKLADNWAERISDAGEFGRFDDTLCLWIGSDTVIRRQS